MKGTSWRNLQQLIALNNMILKPTTGVSLPVRCLSSWRTSVPVPLMGPSMSLVVKGFLGNNSPGIVHSYLGWIALTHLPTHGAAKPQYQNPSGIVVDV